MIDNLGNEANVVKVSNNANGNEASVKGVSAKAHGKEAKVKRDSVSVHSGHAVLSHHMINSMQQSSCPHFRSAECGAAEMATVLAVDLFLQSGAAGVFLRDCG